MNQNRALSLIAAPLLSLGIALAAGDAAAQSVKNIAGTWTIVAVTNTQDGKTSDTFGPKPQGSLIIDPNGRYSLILARAGIPKFASNRDKGTAEENKATVQGSLAHFGRISVSEADKSFTFHIESSTYPNWNGTTQKRPFTVSGDELSYSVAAASGGGAAKVVWKRAK